MSQLLSNEKRFVFQKLILSETAIFDVLTSFFYHGSEVVRMASLEVSQLASMIPNKK